MTAPEIIFFVKKNRTRMVQREQEKLRRNLAKYNNFVREKESKVNYHKILGNIVQQKKSNLAN